MLPFDEHFVGIVNPLLDELLGEYDILLIKEFGDKARVNLMHLTGRLLEELFLPVVSALSHGGVLLQVA